MNNETNRLSQLIATAADRELGTRPDGQPRRQDKAAALAIEAEYMFIRRSELPPVGRCGCSSNALEVDGDCWGGEENDALKMALEYLAVWQHKEIQAAKEREAFSKRRDELAGQFRGEGIPYADVSPPLKLAIDHIITIEKDAA